MLARVSLVLLALHGVRMEGGLVPAEVAEFKHLLVHNSGYELEPLCKAQLQVFESLLEFVLDQLLAKTQLA